MSYAIRVSFPLIYDTVIRHNDFAAAGVSLVQNMVVCHNGFVTAGVSSVHDIIIRHNGFVTAGVIVVFYTVVSRKIFVSDGIFLVLDTVICHNGFVPGGGSEAFLVWRGERNRRTCIKTRTKTKHHLSGNPVHHSTVYAGIPASSMDECRCVKFCGLGRGFGLAAIQCAWVE